MTTAYVTTPQVRNAMRSSYTGQDDPLISSQIIPAACSWLDKYCNRANGGFAIQTYDELIHGTGTHILFLNNTPVQSIQKLSTTNLAAMSVHNQDTDLGSQATAQIIGTPTNPDNLNSQYTSTGLKLVYIKNAVTTTTTLLWTDYPTVSQIVAAVNALGNFWQANVQGGLGSYASTDLRATQGAFGAKPATCYFWVQWWSLPWYRLNENTGEIHSPMGFARGSNNWRCNYTAGYAYFPEDLTQALCEVCANTYYAREQNSNLASENLGGYSYSQLVGQAGFEGLSLMSKKTIDRYKVRKIGKFSQW